MEWVRLLKTFILLDLQFQRAQSDFNESVTDGTLHHKTRNKKNASRICGFTISVWIHLCPHRACSYFVISWALICTPTTHNTTNELKNVSTIDRATWADEAGSTAEDLSDGFMISCCETEICEEMQQFMSRAGFFHLSSDKCDFRLDTKIKWLVWMEVFCSVTINTNPARCQKILKKLNPHQASSLIGSAIVRAGATSAANQSSPFSSDNQKSNRCSKC